MTNLKTARFAFSVFANESALWVGSLRLFEAAWQGIYGGDRLSEEMEENIFNEPQTLCS